MLGKTKPFNSDMLIIKWKNKTVIVASLIVLMQANGNGFSKAVFYFPCSLEINNMVPAIAISSRDVLDTGRSLELASIFPKCNDGLDKPSYSWSDHQWVLTDLPLPVSDPFQKHFPSTGGDSLGVNWCQHCNYSSTQNLPILDYFCIFRLLLQKKTKCSHSICKGYPGTM